MQTNHGTLIEDCSLKCGGDDVLSFEAGCELCDGVRGVVGEGVFVGELLSRCFLFGLSWFLIH